MFAGRRDGGHGDEDADEGARLGRGQRQRAAGPASRATSTVYSSGMRDEEGGRTGDGGQALGAELDGPQEERESERGGDADRETDGEGASERRASSRRRCTSATQSPARGPNSGPTTIAPMIRITESCRIPSAAIIVASTMKARKLNESSALSEVWNSTVSQTTASAGEPTAARSRIARPARRWRRSGSTRSSRSAGSRARGAQPRGRWRPRGRRRRG